MTGNDAAFGFLPYGPVLRQRMYAVQTAPTINVYLNDIVAHGGTSVATQKMGSLPIIADDAVPDGSGAGNLLGSVTAIFDENMKPVKRIVATEAGDDTVAGYVMVADHPQQLFVVQEDSDSNAIEAAEMGYNVDIKSQALCAGTAATGRSLMELGSTTAANTATLDCKLHSAHPADTVASDYCRYIVSINAHFFGDNIIGV